MNQRKLRKQRSIRNLEKWKAVAFACGSLNEEAILTQLARYGRETGVTRGAKRNETCQLSGKESFLVAEGDHSCRGTEID